MASEPAPMIEDALPAPAKTKKLALRLDNGTLIRPNGQAAEVLTPSRAMEEGLLSEAHLLKMQALLCEVHAKLPEEGPLKSISLGSKRSLDSVLEIGQTVSTKKTRSMGEFIGNGTSAPAPAPSVAPPPAAPVSVQNWTSLARNLIMYLRGTVLKGSTAFDLAVDPNHFKDYYTHIKEPMYFNKILQKLAENEYDSPKGFYDDVLLVCDNCYKFNVEVYPSDFGTTGVVMENAFLRAWAKSPMAVEVPPRPERALPVIPLPTAVGAGAFPRRAAAGRGPHKRGGGGGPRGGGRGGRRPGRPPGSGMNRAKSVNSYAPALTQQQQERLFAALNNQETLSCHMEAIVGILQTAGEVSHDEDGDVELDLQKITPPTLSKIYQLVCGGAVAPAPAPSGFTMDRDDGDWDMEEEDE